jgi:hypothetical protein
VRGVLQVLLVLGALGASGCGAALVIHREIPRPAAIPARGYPVVYLASAPDDASRAITSEIEASLAASATRVVRVPPDALLTAARTETVATLALRVQVSVHEDLRTEMSQVPVTRCAPDTPCYGYPERFPVDVRVQVGTLAVLAIDPASGDVLGRAALREEESEPSPIAAQLAVVDRLRARAATLFDVRAELVELEHDALSDPAGRAAIDDARAGHLHAARLALAARLADPTLEEASRAAVAFDLGQLIRADVDAGAPDPVAEEMARLASAEEQLLVAIRLVPDERHERALTQLRAERTAREDVRAQAAAAELNFRAAAGVTP